MKFHILHEEKNAKDQLKLLKSERPDRVYPWPTFKLLQSLLTGDARTVDRQCQQAAKKYLDAAGKQKALLKENRDQITLDYGHLHARFLWPWPEGGVAMLMRMQGHSIKHDSPYLPAPLLGG